MGSSRLLTRKSSPSSTVEPGPSGWNADQMLYPSTQGRLAMRMNAPPASTLLRRSRWNASIRQAMMFSNTAMTVVKLAKVMNRKNSAPHSRPPAIPANTLGSVMKIRLGPLSGLTPNVKQAGKMISPALMATKVSSTQMRALSPGSVYLRSI